jgi:hypothetical protein
MPSPFVVSEGRVRPIYEKERVTTVAIPYEGLRRLDADPVPNDVGDADGTLCTAVVGNPWLSHG